jgi:hypothetical protein
VNPLADTDRDGMRDGDEIVAGTSPIDPLDYLRVLSAAFAIGENRSVMSLKGSAGRWYSLQARTNLTAGTWQDVPGSTNILGDGSVLALTNSVLLPQNFYRVKVWTVP